MIQFYVQDTYPTYSVTFYREGILTDKIHGIAKDDLDEVVFGFNGEDKEQILSLPDDFPCKVTMKFN